MGNPIEANAPPPMASAPISDTMANAPPPPSYQNAYPQMPPQQPQVQHQQPLMAPAPQAYAPGTTVIVQQPGVQVVRPPMFTRNSAAMVCQFCQANITTSTRNEMGLGSWVICGALCFFTGFCCCWPCCCGECQDVVHSCPNCKRVVGRKAIM